MTKQTENYHAIIGGYSPNAAGIESLVIDPATGAVTDRNVYSVDANHSWFEPGQIVDGQRVVYAVDEKDQGTLLAYKYDYESNAISRFGDYSLVLGDKPVCLSLHPTNQWIASANYGSGNIKIHYLFPGGEIGPEMSSVEGLGPLGPAIPVSAPPGSFAASGHDAPHAHFVEFSSNGNYLLHTDLARDEIYVWGFDSLNGTIDITEPVSRVKVSPGGGARHLAFFPSVSQPYLYAITEESSELYVFSFDDQSGELEELQVLSALPDGFEGTNYASDLILTADGRYLLCANRLHNSIGVYSVNSGTGFLTLLSHVPCQGDYPRSITLDPEESNLYVMNQKSDAITRMAFDKGSGSLAFDGTFIASGAPAKLVFL